VGRSSADCACAAIVAPASVAAARMRMFLMMVLPVREAIFSAHRQAAVNG
jgi:hypothetical protein